MSEQKVQKPKGFATRAIQGAHYHNAGHAHPVTVPLFQTASFAFASAEEHEAIAAGHAPGFYYSRVGNPTTDVLHHLMADLEGGEQALSFASGMGAIHAAMLAVVSAGDHIVCTDRVYGGTYSLVARTLARLGVTHTFVDMTDLEAVRRAMRPETRLLWAETISNPLTVVLDLQALAALAHKQNASLGVDNTFASPYLARPLEQGADLIAHSATKYIGGHGDLVAGVVVGSKSLVRRALVVCADAGGCAAPLEAWLMIRGLKTLSLRMDRHCANAAALARFLEAHPAVARVYYPGLPNHPQHALASERLAGFGGMVSFEVEGGKERAFQVMNRLQLVLRASSLGDADTLVLHPASISHRRISPTDYDASGITPGLIRVSAGLEDSDDIIDDFRQALESD